MTSDRHLALMALMTEIEEPSKAYYRSVRQAGTAFTDSPEYDRAVNRGATALDQIETAVRMWVESNRPQAIPDCCGVISPDGRFACALEPHTNAVLHADRPDTDLKPGERQMVWETPTVLPDGFERHTCITVKCTACGYGYDETEYDHHFPGLGDALDGAIGAGWDELKDGRVLCEAQDEKHKELRHTVGVVDDSDT